MVTQVNAEARGDERGALLAFLEAERGGIRRALLGLSEERAASVPSASELSLSGLLKHASEVEQSWLARARGTDPETPRTEENWHESFRLVGEETVEEKLAYWDKVAGQTEMFILGRESLDETFELPDAPWFPPDERVSMRWLLLRLITEMSRHAGHADIIRESLDGRTAFELVALERGGEQG
ncbi:DinB family protein [Streptomyces sp. AK02-01A]|uniref:DinB family protein n=1 Tax=Streptomyces sp. AK02-01A TaxID=3028648 RepID=UPI0029B895B4|nr:DinB family protein [Streptomyces sp. AK02-01A]MDX3850935.1 DinB family protein [Streptomyces sp. AK02-01A]